jgi:predicted  nucleic acid-binding Zn ribbon protein
VNSRAATRFASIYIKAKLKRAVKAVIYFGVITTLQIDFGSDQTALIDPSQIVEE